NALVGQSALARTSNTPGRTQELNQFAPEAGGIRLVDMPGYGFAKAPKPAVEKWNKLIHQFLRGRPNLRRVYVLVDARHGPKPNDATVMNELDKAAVSYQVVLTKADKLGEKDLDGVVAATVKFIVKRPAAHPEIILTSSEKGLGIDTLRREVAGLREGL
ncbi:MAG: ribosome biogenesis GTP-binding protein YihA/YsxC, partial [Alphaproteobacteria bacterium]